MRLYLFSSQDLIIRTENDTIEICGDNIVRINFVKDEKVFIYPKFSQGVMVVDEEVLCNKLHQQINFYDIADNVLLCEIKPFVDNCSYKQFDIGDSHLKLIKYSKQLYIEYNNINIGSIKGDLEKVKFEKLTKNKKEYGLLITDNKQIILFDTKEIIYNFLYIDYELKEEYIQIYAHPTNVFNVGQLVKFDFNNCKLENKLVSDKKEEQMISSKDFNVIYFLDGIKCGRFKYAYNILSYELKANINIDILSKYFKEFDNFIYLYEEDAYITIKNNKIVGIYHFVVKNDLIDNIY